MSKTHPRHWLVVAVALGLALTGTLTAAGPAHAGSPTSKPAPGQAPTWNVPVMREAVEIAASGSGDCTAWRNTILPPPSIRVYREAYGPLEGTVEVVPFLTWAEQVLRTQMPAYYPMEALKANALTVKQFGWYYTINYRGGVAPDGNCYDVRDTTDGFYRPEVYTPEPQHIAAMAATWPYTVRKWDWGLGTSRFFLTGYRAGQFVECGQETDGFHLFQHSAFECGKDGMNWEGILRVYLEPKLEFVDPGIHNLVAGVRADAGVLDGATSGVLTGLTYESTGSAFHAAPDPTLSVDTATLRGLVAADVTGDRLDDVVTLIDSPDGAKLRVSKGNGSGYDAPVTWWTDTQPFTNASTKLIADDFDGDGTADAALVTAVTDPAGKMKVHVLTSRGNTFNAPKVWWGGTFDMAPLEVYAGDTNGDGRGDVILERDLGGDYGMEYLVLRSAAAGGALEAPASWLTLTGLRRATTKTVIADTNRDGRDDVVVAYPWAGGGTRIAALRASNTTPTFSLNVIWSSSTSEPLPFAKLKLGAGDYNIDGRGDILLMSERAKGGTRMKVLLPNDTGGTVSKWYDAPTLEWATARTY